MAGGQLPLKLIPCGVTIAMGCYHVHEYFTSIFSGGVGKNGSTVAVSGRAASLCSDAPRSSVESVSSASAVSAFYFQLGRYPERQCVSSVVS